MTTQGLELLLALAAIAVLGKGKFADYGFRLPKIDPSAPGRKVRYGLSVLVALFLGIVATIAMLALDGNGNPVVRQLSIPQIMLFVWVSSSVIEEILTRGFLQSHLSALSGKYVKPFGLRIELPVLISALFFACMHLILPFVGADATTTVVTFLFTLSIGFLAGHLRAKTGSLLPAIGAHMLANIGGMIGGIIYNVVSFIITGKLPTA
jgi:membrane protease YdiL (CAAX protease family)